MFLIFHLFCLVCIDQVRILDFFKPKSLLDSAINTIFNMLASIGKNSIKYLNNSNCEQTPLNLLEMVTSHVVKAAHIKQYYFNVYNIIDSEM